MKTGDRSRATALIVVASLIGVLIALALWLDTGADDASPLEAPGEPTLPFETSRLNAPAGRNTREPLPARDTDTPLVELTTEQAAAWPAGVERVCLSGRVVDARGAPWPGATVVLVPDSTTSAAIAEAAIDRVLPMNWTPARDGLGDLPRTTSDADGRFAVCGPWRAVARVTPSRAAPRNPVLTIKAPGMAWHGHAVAGFDGTSLDVGDLPLVHAEAALMLRVLDEDGTPLTDAAVSLRGSLQQSEADDDPTPPTRVAYGVEHVLGMSDIDGRVRLDGRWPSTLTLNVHAPGFVTGRVKAELRAGETVDAGDVFLTRGATVRGRVLRASGAPIAGAEVQAHTGDLSAQAVHEQAALLDVASQLLLRPWFSTARTRTTSDGSFVLSGLDADDVVSLVARAESFRPTHVAGVRPGDADVELVLSPSASTHVRVLSAVTGAELDDAQVVALRRTHPGGDASEDMPGDLWQLPPLLGRVFMALDVHSGQIDDVGPLGALLLISASGHRSVRRELPPSESDTRHTLTVELPPGPDASWLLVDESGEPLPDVLVRLEPEGDLARALGVRTALSDAEGRASFTDLPAVRWSGEARAAHRTPATIPEFHGGDPGESTTLVLPIASGVTGMLREADGTAARDALVHAERADVDNGSRKFASTDRHGRFAFNLEPGLWTLKAEPGAQATVSVEGGERADVTLQLTARIILRGRVTSGAEPLDAVKVEVMAGADQGLRGVGDSTRSDHDGHYTLALPRADSYHVVCTLRNGPTLSYPLVVREGEAPRLDVDFGTSAVRGRVVVGAGAEPPARTLVVSVDRITEDSASGRKRAGFTRTDAEGRFALSPLPVGDYVLHASSDDSLPVEQRIRLGPGQTRNVTLSLQPAAYLSGTVTYPDGSGFDGFVHLRQVDGQGYEVGEVDSHDGWFEFSSLAPGLWRLDLARFWEPQLGHGDAGRGEPGVALPRLLPQRELLLEGDAREELELIVDVPAQDG